MRVARSPTPEGGSITRRTPIIDASIARGRPFTSPRTPRSRENRNARRPALLIAFDCHITAHRHGLPRCVFPSGRRRRARQARRLAPLADRARRHRLRDALRVHQGTRVARTAVCCVFVARACGRGGRVFRSEAMAEKKRRGEISVGVKGVRDGRFFHLPLPTVGADVVSVVFPLARRSSPSAPMSSSRLPPPRRRPRAGSSSPSPLSARTPPVRPEPLWLVFFATDMPLT